MPRVRRCEHQRPHLAPPARLRVEHHPELTEIDLQLAAWFPVSDSHRQLRARREILSDIPVQRPFRHHHTTTGEELTHLHDRDIIINPTLQAVMLAADHRPHLTMTIRSHLNQRDDHLADEHVRQLAVATITIKTSTDRRLDDPTDRLSVRPDHLSNRSQPAASKPQTQHLTHLKHRDLPERHSAPPSWADRRQGGENDRPRHPHRGPPNLVLSNWRPDGPIYLARTHPKGPI